MAGAELDVSSGLNTTTRAKRAMKNIAKPLGLRLGVFAQHTPVPMRAPSKPVATAPSHRPRVSIVTPSFNQRRFLEATAESVLGQGYPNLEYVVMDGGSQDGSADYLRSIESRLTAWRSEPDRGQADAINKAFALTSGEIMAWINSDDLLLPGAIDAVVAHFQSHPNVDVVYGQRLVIDHDGREVGRWVLPRHSTSAFLWRDYIPQETLFWRRSLWDRCGSRVDASFQFAMDWELVLRFHEHGARFARLPRYLGAFRTHDEQKSLAQVEKVGRPEFERLRQRYFPNTWSRHWQRAGGAAYLLRSIGYSWLEAAGLVTYR
ncbi:MAG: glycosyltransferase [Phycisphaerales bacterium]|nr:glycosyltransferase [Phycisphaerales bacterium]